MDAKKNTQIKIDIELDKALEAIDEAHTLAAQRRDTVTMARLNAAVTILCLIQGISGEDDPKAHDESLAAVQKWIDGHPDPATKPESLMRCGLAAVDAEQPQANNH